MRDTKGQKIMIRGPGHAFGIDDELIFKVVDHFYRRVRQDDMLGPIFASRVTDWPHHLQNLTDFWSSILLGSGLYKGTPVQAHMALPDISREHFERWLRLFAATVEDCSTPEQAALFKDRATRIATSLSMAVEQKQRPSHYRSAPDFSNLTKQKG